MSYNLPFGNLSPTQVTTYHKCGEQYRIFTVEGARRPPDFFLTAKRATHEAILEHDLAHKKETGRNRADSEIQEFYRAKMEQSLPEIKADPLLKNADCEKLVEDETSYFDKIVAATARFRHDTVPLEIEKPFEFNVGNVPVKVRIDLIEDETICSRVSDLKRKGRAAQDPGSSLQLTTYAIGTGIHDVGFRTIVENKMPKLDREDGEITSGQIEKTVVQYEKTAAMISAGIFMPVINEQNSWACSAQWCGAWPKDATDWMTGRLIACRYGERAAVSVAIKKEVPK